MHTPYRILAVFLGILLLMPSVAQAAVFKSGQEYQLLPQGAVLENLYVWAGRVGISGQVHGDVMLSGGSLTVTGDILDDALLMGGSITVFGLVGGDLRVAGGQVSIGGEVGGDFAVAGGSIHLMPESVIQGDVSVVGGEVILDGIVEGDVTVAGGTLVLNGTVFGDTEARVKDELRVGATAVVGGTLSYRAPQRANIPDGAQIEGEVLYDALQAHKNSKGAGTVLAGIGALFLGALFSLKVLAMLGFALLLVLMWRKWVLAKTQELFSTFSTSLGQGIISFIVIPIVILLLLISFIGTLIGVAAAASYVVVLLMARVFAGIVLGAWLGKMFSKKKVLRITVAWTVGGVLVLEALNFVPFIGWLVVTLFTVAMLGLLVREMIHRLHA